MSEELLNAVKAWVRADYQFRFGQSAYSAEATEWLLRAEKRLRKQACAVGSLEKAFESIGGTPTPPRRIQRQNQPYQHKGRDHYNPIKGVFE